MRDPVRIDTFLDVLRNAWKESPDLRFGQLVDNAYSAAVGIRDSLAPDMFYVEDDDMLRGIVENMHFGSGDSS